MPTKPNGRLPFLTNGGWIGKLKFLYFSDAGGAFKDYGDLYKVKSLSRDLANMDANTLNYWLDKFV